MPLALRDLQSAFAAQLAGEDQPGLAAEIHPAAARLRIHRHHILDSLCSALAATFPTVQAVVGADFFRGLARGFVGRSLPSQPVLAEYGEDFPAFIAGHDAARDLPYLADVARLDWALNLAFHAPAGGRLAAADLTAVPVHRLPSLRLALAPGTALICSPYPLDRIWAASQPDVPADAVDIDGGGAFLLVLRRPDDAAFVTLSAGEAAFVTGIVTGLSLEEAAGRAHSGFDLTASFGRLLALGVFAAPQ
ncbi:MAG: putative DNA-binding domain-containing protein [Rhodospirillales bacterium]|nr:putative DNA-binding domain-containing protein [Rhodospirillales bacterium]